MAFVRWVLHQYIGPFDVFSASFGKDKTWKVVVYISGSCLARYLRRYILSSGVALQECHGTSTILYWDYNKSFIVWTRKWMSKTHVGVLFVFFCFCQVTLNFGPDFQFPPTDEEFQPVRFKPLIHLINLICWFFIISTFVLNNSRFWVSTSSAKFKHDTLI